MTHTNPSRGNSTSRGRRIDPSLQTVDACCRPPEHRSLLVLGEVRRNLLAGIPEHRVAERPSVDRKVALEHAALRAEAVDGVAVVRPLDIDELIACDGCCVGLELGHVPVEPVVGHRQPAELGDDVRVLGDGGNVVLPLFENGRSSAGEHSHPEGGAEMIEHHGGVRDGSGKIAEILVLMVIVPGVEGEPTFTETAHAGAEAVASVQVCRRATRNRERIGLEGRCSCVTNPDESPTGRCGVGVEDLVEVGTLQIGVGNDARNDRLIVAPLTLSRVGGNELGLTNRAQVLGSAIAIRSVAFDEHGLHNMVTGTRIGVKIVEAVGQSSTGWPQMMVGIDDSSSRIDDLLGEEFRPFLHDGTFSHAGTMAQGTRDAYPDAAGGVRLH